MLLCPKLINILFLAIFNLAISSDQRKAQIASLILLECGWPRQTTPNHNYDLKKFSFPSLSLSLSKKSKTLIDTFQCY